MAGNHRSGRRPKPTAEKLAAGNPGKRKLGVEPAFDTAEVLDPPTWLGEYGQAEWRRIVPQMLRERSLSEVDTPSLEAYCAAYQRAIACEIAIGDMLLVEGERHPLITVAAQAWDKVRAFAAEFGLTPATRPKVAKFTEADADPLQEFANQRNEA